jgi:heme oxygenase
MSLTADPTLGPSFAAAIRSATAGAHRGAEGTSFLDALLGGALPLTAYGRLVVQHHAIYDALEAANRAMTADPVAGAFVDADIVRRPALERDAVAVLGPDWRARPEAELVPATIAYCERLREVGATWPGGWVAHQYVRYLGDLSGGRFIRTRIEAVYGIDETSGTAFYAFPKVPDPTAWKDAYRRRLDLAPWDDAERARIVDEVLAAYAWNTELLHQLHA